MKKLLAILMILTMLLTSAIGVAETTDVPTIKIALIAAMTGTNAMIGYYQKLGAEYMINKINENGGIKSLGGAKLELVIGDLQSDASLAKTVTESVCDDPAVVAITGATSSTYVLAMLPTVERIGIPMIAANGAATICEQGYTYIFQTSAKAPVMAKVQIEYLKWLNDEYGYVTDKVGILYRDDDFGVSTAENSNKLVSEAGFDVVYYQSFPTTISDASSLVTGLKQSGAEVLFLTSEVESSKLIIDAMNSMDYHPVIIGSASGITQYTFAEELGDYCIGMSNAVIFTYDSKNITDNEVLHGYVQEYYDMYGHYPIEGTLYEMSHIMIIADALERCASTDRDVLRDAIAETYLDVMNPGGTMQFDETGASKNSTYVVFQWQKNDKGEYVQTTVFPAEYATGEFLDQR